MLINGTSHTHNAQTNKTTISFVRYEDDNWSRSSTKPNEGLQQSSSSQLLQQRHWRNRGSSHSQSPPTTTSSLSTLLPEVSHTHHLSCTPSHPSQSDSVDSDDDSVLMDHDTS